MEKVTKYFLVILMPLFLVACKEQSKIPIVAQYNFYQNDTIVPERAVIVKYKQNGKADFSKVTISSGDSTLAVYYEKVTDSGILRSLVPSGFKLSHSFYTSTEIELKFEEPVPFFLNVLTKNHSTKIFPIDKNDSSEVILFDEAIPWYSYTCSYYLRETSLFLIFYDCKVEEDRQYRISQDRYYKLFNVQGLDTDMGYLNKLANKIISDKSFFAKYYKFPVTAPLPPLR